MSGLHLVLTIACAVIISLALTRLVERYAARLGLIQVPNIRSSHVRPTPSGGGISTAIVGIFACICLAPFGEEPFAILAVLLTAITLLGFIDDLRDLPIKVRFLIQTLILIGLLAAFSPLPTINLPFGLLLGGLLLFSLVLLAGLWWLNLFNFMDGIDGLAASQAVLILVAGALIWWLGDPAAPRYPLFALMWLIAAGTTGFLICNWPPARIFMGDAGSNFLALAIFSIALMAISIGGLSYPVWLILVGALASDATITLLRRIVRGEKGWIAHRRHGYQQLSRRWGHKRTTLAYGAVTLLFLAPCAWLASTYEFISWPIAAFCYFFLAVGMILAGSGSAKE